MESIAEPSPYLRKPLRVAVPVMDDVHSRKNPFSRTLYSNTVTSTQGGTLSDLKEKESLKKRSNTVRIKVDELPRFPINQILMPHRLDGEGLEDWMIGEKIENEGKRTGEETKIEGTEKDQVSITEELKHNFKIIRTLSLPTEEEIKSLKIPFPETSKKTLVLDLDETLIHTIDPSLDYSALNVKRKEIKPIFYRDNKNPNVYSIKVLIRPFAIEFLKELSKDYEIVVKCS